MPPKRADNPKPAAKPAKGKGASVGGAADQVEPNAEHEDCCEAAWQALAEGVFTLRGISRWVEARTGHHHTHNWVKGALERHSRLVEATVDNGAVSARAQYLQGLYTDLVAQNVLAKGAEKEADRIRARREMTEIRAKIAAAQGVVTQRAAHEVSGTLQVDHGSEAIESLTRAIASIAARSGQGSGDPQPDPAAGKGAAD